MKRAWKVWSGVLALTAVTLWGAGCRPAQDSSLGRDLSNGPAVNPTVALSGQYCTDDPNFNVPIRVLLVMDTSQSMQINDPSGGRGTAASNLITGLMNQGVDVSFALVGFDTAAQSLTSGFSNDRAQLLAATSGLNTFQGFTNFLDALGTAKTVIDADVAATAQTLSVLEQQGKDTRYMRPAYFVVFLSDGPPRMPGGVLQSTESVLFQVDQLVQTPRYATSISLNTVFLGAVNDALRPESEVLLKQMAERGRGSYASFTTGSDIDLQVFMYEVRRSFDIKQVLAYNRSSTLGLNDSLPVADSDQDGLSDAEEDLQKTQWGIPDTDGDGLGDGFEVRLALDPLVPNAVCANPAAAQDGDNDGLNDCEEQVLNLSSKRFDTDVDLFPDRMELLAGANPVDPKDMDTDLDFDGVTAGRELRAGTKLLQSDQAENIGYGLAYYTSRVIDPANKGNCYQYQIGNVGLVMTRAAGGRPAGQNEVVLEFIESPMDAPDRVFALRRFVFSVDVNTTTIELTPDKPFTLVSLQESN